MASHERYKLFFINGSFMLFLVIGCVVTKPQQSHYTCGTGISTPGYTFPLGDITLEYGSDLDIVCVLYDNKASDFGDNASSYMKIKWSDKVQPTDIVNSTAIKLHIEKHPKTEGADYACSVRDTFVCHNVIVVGTKPQNVTDFQCIGYNYENLTCSWTAPENYVKTNYDLEYSISSRPSRFPNKCPNISSNENKSRFSCTWSLATVPQYRHSHEFFKFTLYASNTFGNNSQEIPFDNWSHVVPNPPENLTANATSPHSVKIRWVVPLHMQSFNGGLEYRVSYYIIGKDWQTYPIEKPEKISKEFEYELKNLPYAHYLYDIRVSMKSAKAKEERLWSRNSTVFATTLSKLPDRPPRTDVGSFEYSLDTSKRIVYWQKIHEYEGNGQNFSYYIEVDGHPDIKPKSKRDRLLTSNHAEFENLSDQNYTFKIWSKNEIGVSTDYSVVFVPATSKSVKGPSKLLKEDLGNGQYYLEWFGGLNPEVVHYTIFWCLFSRDRPYQCDGTLDWLTVPNDVRNITLSLKDSKGESQNVYQFAISANSNRSSSGMLWAECTVITGKGARFAQNPYVKTVYSREMIIAWKLDCVKRGDVKGYNITYCAYVNESCSEPEKFTIEHNSEANEGRITGLKPYTGYKIRVKPLFEGVESHSSEAIVNSTLADTPTQPRDLKVKNKTNSSITITWRKPEEENGKITYNISVIGVNGIRNEPPEYIKNNENVLGIYERNITNLTAYTTYTVKILACTGSNIPCSDATIPVITAVGRPGQVPQPSANWDNSTVVMKWEKPQPTAGKVDFYEVWVSSKNKEMYAMHEGDVYQNVTGQRYAVGICGEDKSLVVHAKIRAVNILAEKELLRGPWSERADFPCIESASSQAWVIPIIAFACIIFVLLMYYLGKKFYIHYLHMSDVDAKLPEGLAAAVESSKEKESHADDTLPPDYPLLDKESPLQQRSNSGESSGCSSGHGSVVSSTKSAGNLSLSDSGTEQPRSPSLGEADTRDVALRQRVTKPTKKSDYITMPEITQTAWSPKQMPGGYSQIGLPHTKKPELESEFLGMPDMTAKSSYVPFGSTEPPESSSDQSLRTPPSGYVPYIPQEPPGKNTEYILTDVPAKNIILPKVPFILKEEPGSRYVKPPLLADTAKLAGMFPWQSNLLEPPSSGYVQVGDPKPPRPDLELHTGSKGYVPHNIKFDTTKSIKED